MTDEHPKLQFGFFETRLDAIDKKLSVLDKLDQKLAKLDSLEQVRTKEYFQPHLSLSKLNLIDPLYIIF